MRGLSTLLPVVALFVLVACGAELDAGSEAKARDEACAAIGSDRGGCEGRGECAPSYLLTTKDPVDCRARCSSDDDCGPSTKCVLAELWTSDDPDHNDDVNRPVYVCRP